MHLLTCCFAGRPRGFQFIRLTYLPPFMDDDFVHFLHLKFPT